MSTTPTDTPAPRLLVSVTEIRRRPGSRLPVHLELEAHGLALPDAAVPDGATVELDGEVESIHEGVCLTATVTVPWVGTCRRCLDEIGGRASVELREIWETNPVDGETWPLEQDHIDVGPLLHDQALLALPLAPLCAEDCAGPAPERQPVTVAAEDDETAEPPKDPRWAALDGLEF